MSSAVVPQWKVALQQKLDKKKEEERRKAAEEEQRRLAALPPWKRMGMVPQNVIIISGGTKTVSNLSSGGSSPSEEAKKEPAEDKTAKTVSKTSPDAGRGNNVVKSADSRTNAAQKKSSAVNASPAAVNASRAASLNHNSVANHIGGDDDTDGSAVLGNAKATPATSSTSTSTSREGVDEEHVSSVFDNPFLKLDTGRKRRVSPILRPDSLVKPAPEIRTEEPSSAAAPRRQPESSIRQRSRSESPHRAAQASQAKVVEPEPSVPVRKSSVSDLRSRFGQAASTEDLRVVSRKHSDTEDGLSPLTSPRSPVLDRNMLFDNSHKVHITTKAEPSKRLAPTAPAGAGTTTPSTRASAEPKPVVITDTAASQKSTAQTTLKAKAPGTATTSTTNTSNTTNGVRIKRQAPTAPAVTSSSSTSSQKESTPASNSAITPPSTTNSASHQAIKTTETADNKPVLSSTVSESSGLLDQPKTAVLGDGGSSSLRRKKGLGKISASALISLTGVDGGNEVQLSEHNARVRAARQEKRASANKAQPLPGATAAPPTGTAANSSSGVFGASLKPVENNIAPSSRSDDNDPIPYPTNFRQPKKESATAKPAAESTYVDPIPYPENFRQPKAGRMQEPAAAVKAAPEPQRAAVKDDIPRTNIDEVVLMPIQEDGPLTDTSQLVNGSLDHKPAPKNLKKKMDVQWIGFNTPTGKPSALKSRKAGSNQADKGMRITFDEANLSTTYEYQSESSLLNEYLREERGLNGNPRLGNLSRQEAQVQDEDEDLAGDVTSSSSSQGSMENVLAHEGLQSYTPKDLQNFSPMSFRQQQQQQQQQPDRTREEPPQPASPQSPAQDPDDIAITYEDTGDYFSSAGSGSAALLF